MDLQVYSEQTIIPSRSKFQLRNFVVNQHDTPPMRWRQVLLEAQDLAYKIRLAEISVKKAKIQIDRLLQTGDPIDALEAEEKRLGAVLTERTLAGARQELAWLQELAEEIGPHTFEQIEADQPKYWQLRLKRQASVDVESRETGIGQGNLQSMLNAGIIVQAQNQLPAGDQQQIISLLDERNF